MSMRWIFILFLIFFCLGCTHQKECQRLKQFFIKDINCKTGYSIPGITGHNPECLSPDDYQKIKKECPDF